MTYGDLKLVGKTYSDIPIYSLDMNFVNVYQCTICKARQTSFNDGCYMCKKQAEPSIPKEVQDEST